MFASWQSWCKKAGEDVGNNRSLQQALLGRPGLTPTVRHGGKRGWKGRELISETLQGLV